MEKAVLEAQSQLQRRQSSDIPTEREEHPNDYWRSRYASEDDEGIAKGYALLEEDSRMTPSGGYLWRTTPPTCPKTCLTCQQHYRPLELQKYAWLGYESVYGDMEAAREIDRLRDSSKTNIEHVRRMLDRHGNSIAKRWLKRNTEKRANLLRATEVDLYSRKWMSADLPIRTFKTGHREEVEHNLWLLPWLDLPTLSEDASTLLTLLHNRTAYDPAAWMMHDSEALRTSFALGDVRLGYNPQCVIMHGTQYGLLVPWEEAAAHRWDIVGFPRAKLILEAQCQLSDFLKQMVGLLIGEEAAIGNDQWLQLATANFNRQVTCEIAGSYCEPAFSAPPRFQLKHVVDVLKERMYAAEDELYLMQTDPAHVRQVLDNARNARQYQRLHIDQAQRELVGLITAPLKRLDHWQCVVGEAEVALEVYEQHKNAVDCGRDMPEAYDLAMRMLESVLSRQFSDQCAELRSLAAALPTFEDHFYRCNKPGCTKLHIRKRSGGGRNFRDDKLFWAVGHIGEREWDDSSDPTFVLKLMNHEIALRSDRTRIDQMLHDHICDMAATDEALLALRHHRPHIRPALGKEEYEKLKSERPIRGDHLVRIASDADSITDLLTIRVLAPLTQILILPPPSSRLNKDSVKHFVEAHGALAEYWDEVRAFKTGVMGRAGPSMESIEKMMQPISVCKTKAYAQTLDRDCNALAEAVKQQEEERKRALSTPKPRPFRKPLPTTPSQTVWGEENVEQPRRQSLTPREKLKTRKASTQDEAPPDLAQLTVSDEAEIDEKLKIAINAVSLALFRRMFTPIACSKATASVKWDDFVAALGDAGCTSKQTACGGSAVTFMHGAEGASAVVIHRPHPDPSINPIMLSSLAKKFSRRMGWEKDTFVLRGKSEAAKGKK